MTTCLATFIDRSLGLTCVSFVNVYRLVCVRLSPFDFEGGMWDSIVLIHDHCLCLLCVILVSTRYYVTADTDSLLIYVKSYFVNSGRNVFKFSKSSIMSAGRVAQLVARLT